MRTNDGYELLSEQVSDLWGSEQLQRAPSIAVSPEVKGEGLQPASSHVQVDLNLEPRRKGLLWYATYAVDFDGTYTIQNTLTHPVTATVSFVFPGNGAIYDDFEYRVGEVQATPGCSNVGELTIPVTLAPGAAVEAHVAYRSRGWIAGSTASAMASPPCAISTSR
jgi:hypothetical protein